MVTLIYLRAGKSFLLQGIYSIQFELPQWDTQRRIFLLSHRKVKLG